MNDTGISKVLPDFAGNLFAQADDKGRHQSSGVPSHRAVEQPSGPLAECLYPSNDCCCIILCRFNGYSLRQVNIGPDIFSLVEGLKIKITGIARTADCHHFAAQHYTTANNDFTSLFAVYLNSEVIGSPLERVTRYSVNLHKVSVSPLHLPDLPYLSRDFHFALVDA